MWSENPATYYIKYMQDRSKLEFNQGNAKNKHVFLIGGSDLAH